MILSTSTSVHSTTGEELFYPIGQMADAHGIRHGPLASALHLLHTAARSEDALPVRLRALAELNHQLDALFTNPAADSGVRPNLLPKGVALILERTAVALKQQLLPALEQQGLRITPVAQLPETQRAWVHSYFGERVYPLLTPLAVDPGHPFPFISSDSLNLLVELRSAAVNGGEPRGLFARVKVPRATPRLVRLPLALERSNEGRKGGTAGQTLVWSGDLVREFVKDLFPGMPVKQVYLFRVLRAAEGAVCPAAGRNGRWRHDEAPVVRLDVEQNISPAVLSWLVYHLRVPAEAVYRCPYPLEMMCLPQLADYVGGWYGG